MKWLFFFLLMLVVMAFGAKFWLRQAWLERERPEYLQVAKAVQDIRMLTVALERFHSANGRALVTLDQLVPKVISKLPKDPWGHDYIYDVSRPNGTQVYSLGADGTIGGVGECTDFTAQTKLEMVNRRIRLHTCSAQPNAPGDVSDDASRRPIFS
jgi:hypothetical protein